MVEYSRQVGYSSSKLGKFFGPYSNWGCCMNIVCAWFKIANLFTSPILLVNYIFLMQNLFIQVLVQFFSVFSDSKILHLAINFANFTKQDCLNLRVQFPSVLLFHWLFIFLKEIEVFEIVNYRLPDFESFYLKQKYGVLNTSQLTARRHF